MGGACCTNGERIGVYWVLLGEPEGKRPLGRPRPRLKDNIKFLGRNLEDKRLCTEL